jgi:hypothetical protein
VQIARSKHLYRKEDMGAGDGYYGRRLVPCFQENKHYFPVVRSRFNRVSKKVVCL